MIWFNGFPFLDTKEEHTFGVPVSRVMTTQVATIPSNDLNVRSLEHVLAADKFQGFPVVEDRRNNILLGYIGRTELRYALDRTKKEGFVSATAKCRFAPPAGVAIQTPSVAAPPITFSNRPTDNIDGEQQTIDFARFINPTPLTVHPRLPLETVMELFKKMGPRAILVEYRGRLVGLVTVKDVLKYQFKVEAQEHGSARESEANTYQARQERLWGFIEFVADWVADRVLRVSGGRIKLGRGGSNGSMSRASHHYEGQDPRDLRRPLVGSMEGAILDGTEDFGDDDADDRRGGSGDGTGDAVELRER